jgi:hypothetical protein
VPELQHLAARGEQRRVVGQASPPAQAAARGPHAGLRRPGGTSGQEKGPLLVPSEVLDACPEGPSDITRDRRRRRRVDGSSRSEDGPADLDGEQGVAGRPLGDPHERRPPEGIAQSDSEELVEHRGADRAEGERGEPLRGEGGAEVEGQWFVAVPTDAKEETH